MTVRPEAPGGIGQMEGSSVVQLIAFVLLVSVPLLVLEAAMRRDARRRRDRGSNR